jgi:hypothetical protein
MARFSYQDFEKIREEFSNNKISKEEVASYVKAGKLTPSEYKIIVREVYSMYKDVRRDLLKD